MINEKDQKTPLESNGGQLDNDVMIVGCDYLVMSYKGDLSFMYNNDEYSYKSWRFVKSETGTKHFEKKYTVYYNKKLFGELLCKPRSRAIPVETIQLKIDNQLFYMASGLRMKLKCFKDDLELTFNNISRADLYIDFKVFSEGMHFEDFLELYTHGHVQNKGKSSQFNLYMKKINGLMRPNGFGFGSRKSDKYVRCYNKQDEIKESGKWYIQQFWKSNGMVLDENPVYRFEIELKSKFFNKVIGENELGIVENKEFNLLDTQSILEIIKLSTKNYFEFFWEDTTKVRNDDKEPICLFDFSKLSEGLKKAYRYVKEKIVHKGFTVRQKMLVVRNLFKEYVMSCQDPVYLFLVVKIIGQYHLQGKWDHFYWKYLDEFRHMKPIWYEYDHSKYRQHYRDHILAVRR